MDDFEYASELYRRGRQLYDFTHDLAVARFDLRVDREDLDEALLDLKLAVMDQDLRRVRRYSNEVKQLMSDIFLKLAAA